MSPPWNQTTKDLQSEQTFAQSVENDNRCLTKLSKLKFGVDFAIVSKSLLVGNQPKILGVAEIKTRNTSMNQYPTLYLNLTKWMALRRYALLSELPFAILVRWQDQDAMYYETPDNDILTTDTGHTHDSSRFEVSWGGRQDRGQEQDMNPMVHIPIGFFEPIEMLDHFLHLWHKTW